MIFLILIFLTWLNDRWSKMCWWLGFPKCTISNFEEWDYKCGWKLGSRMKFQILMIGISNVGLQIFMWYFKCEISNSNDSLGNALHHSKFIMSDLKCYWFYFCKQSKVNLWLYLVIYFISLSFEVNVSFSGIINPFYF